MARKKAGEQGWHYAFRDNELDTAGVDRWRNKGVEKCTM